jgi:hypothetical protein
MLQFVPKNEAEVATLEEQIALLKRHLAEMEAECCRRGLTLPARNQEAEAPAAERPGTLCDSQMAVAAADGTDRSLADIDEAMRMRGYRCKSTNDVGAMIICMYQFTA